MKIAVTSDLHYGTPSDSNVTLKRFFTEIMTKHPDIKALLIAGDLISYRQTQLPKLMKLIRSIIPTTPVFTINGNHDYWNTKRGSQEVIKNRYHAMTLPEVILYRKDVYREYDIVNLADNTAKIGNVKFFGINGWYRYQEVEDRYDIPRLVLNPDGELSTWETLQNENEIALEATLSKIAASRSKRNILLTHMPPFSVTHKWGSGNPETSLINTHRFHKIAHDKLDYVFFGHTHKPYVGYANNLAENSCQYINVGSGVHRGDNGRVFNRPIFGVFDV